MGILLSILFITSSSFGQNHPCKKDGKYLYQTDKVGPCYNFNAPNTYSPRIYSPLPQDLSGSRILVARIASDLRSKNLSFVDARQAILQTRSLNDSQLNGARLWGIQGRSSSWKRITAVNTDFRAARLTYSYFNNSQLQGSDFRYADLSFSNFSNTSLEGADLRKTITIGTNFKEAKFNSQTKLPFSKKSALAKGMIYLE